MKKILAVATVSQLNDMFNQPLSCLSAKDLQGLSSSIQCLLDYPIHHMPLTEHVFNVLECHLQHLNFKKNKAQLMHIKQFLRKGIMTAPKDCLRYYEESVVIIASKTRCTYKKNSLAQLFYTTIRSNSDRKIQYWKDCFSSSKHVALLFYTHLNYSSPKQIVKLLHSYDFHDLSESCKADSSEQEWLMFWQQVVRHNNCTVFLFCLRTFF